MLSTAIFALVFVATSAWAQSTGGDFTLNRHAIAGGGGHSSGANFDLEGTIGQLDASNVQSEGRFTLVGGFHYSNLPDVGDEIFTDSFDGQN